MASIAFHDPRLSAVSGGGETVTLQLAEILSQHGHAVTIVTRKGARSGLFQSAVNRCPNINFVEIQLPAEEAWAPMAGELWRSDHLAPLSIMFGDVSRQYYEQTHFDMVVVSFIPDIWGLPPKTPVLLNVFGLPPDRTIAAVERPLIDRCRLITFASQFVAERFGDLFQVDTQALHAQVMHAGINQLFYELPCEKQAIFEVCYAGRIEERKGVRTILDAIARLKEKGKMVRLVMVGEGAEKKALIESSIRLGIAEQVTWTGAISPEKVRHVLDQSLVFVYPTLKPEAFGCSNLEAMARGVAVITTNLGGTVDYVQPGENALTCLPGDPNGLGESIEVLLDNSGLRESLASIGRATAERFSQDKMSGRWLSIVENSLLTTHEAV